MARRAALGAVQGGEVDPGIPVVRLVDELLVGEVARECPLDDLRLHVKQPGGGFDEGAPRSPAQCPSPASSCSTWRTPARARGDRVGFEPEGLRDRVGGAEADSADIEGEPVGVLADAVHRPVPVEPVDPDRPGPSPLRATGGRP